MTEAASIRTLSGSHASWNDRWIRAQGWSQLIPMSVGRATLGGIDGRGGSYVMCAIEFLDSAPQYHNVAHISFLPASVSLSEACKSIVRRSAPCQLNFAGRVSQVRAGLFRVTRLVLFRSIPNGKELRRAPRMMVLLLVCFENHKGYHQPRNTIF